MGKFRYIPTKILDTLASKLDLVTFYSYTVNFFERLTVIVKSFYSRKKNCKNRLCHFHILPEVLLFRETLSKNDLTFRIILTFLLIHLNNYHKMTFME